MSKQPIPAKKIQDRVVRVFVSSTFRDMQVERDILVKEIFPELKKRCRERGVEFVEVDLRWGVTEEQAERGEVLPICLAEIENCRPYFIGLLGERYGWVPEDIDRELSEIHPWLDEHREKSVTELEILHGVLNNPDMAERTFFYFRNPNHADSVDEKIRDDFKVEDPESAERLKILKDRIRKSSFPLLEDYPGPETAAKQILEDLWKAINHEFPPGEKLDRLKQEAADHEAYVESRARVYIGRQKYFDKLNAHVQSEGPPLVILGESGLGKSALIANWAIQYREKNPDDFVILHFIGSTPDSADYVHTLRRIMGEIKERYGSHDKDKISSTAPSIEQKEEDEIPTGPEKVVETFPIWLAKAAAKGKLILILDALNQLEDRDNAPDLGWLPGYFPPNIRIVLSTLPGRSLEALRKREWPTYTLNQLNSEERTKVIEEYLGQYRKTLEPKRVKRLSDAEQTSNPLYLHALLEELRIFGIYEELDNRISHYLKASTIDNLYEKILERLETDYEKERPGLVRETMTLIWAARRGLSESELLEILEIPHATWSPLYLALHESLISRSGLLNFFHDFLRKAVEDRYLATTNEKKTAHMSIADYFDSRKIDDRKVDELPWQLHQAESWERLKDCVTNLDIFLKLRTDAKKYELMSYWLVMRDRFDMVGEYNTSLKLYEKSAPSEEELAYMLNEIAFFLYLNARYDGAEPLYKRALEMREKVLGPEHPHTALSLNNLAILLYSKGEYNGAEPLHRRALEISKIVLGPEHPHTASTLNNLAELFRNKGDYDGAEPLYRRALEIREKNLGPEHPDTAQSLNNLALLLYSKGDYDGAEPLYKRDLEISEKVLGPEHPDTATSLNNLALLLFKKRDYGEAEPLYRRALEIRGKVLGPEHPDTVGSLNNLAGLLDKKGDYDGAESLYRRALEIRERVLDPDHPDTALSLINLAGLLRDKGDNNGAEPLYRRALEISEKVLGHEHQYTTQSRYNLAGLLYTRGDYIGAEPLLRRTLEIDEKVLGHEHPDTAQSLNNLAALLDKKGDYDGAEPLYRRVLEIREKVLGPEHPNTALSLNNLAELLDKKGDYDGAEPLYRRVLEICEKVLGPEHPDTAQSLNNLAALLYNKGDYEGAKTYMKTALIIFEKILGPEHPNTVTIRNNLEALGG